MSQTKSRRPVEAYHTITKDLEVALEESGGINAVATSWSEELACFDKVCWQTQLARFKPAAVTPTTRLEMNLAQSLSIPVSTLHPKPASRNPNDCQPLLARLLSYPFMC